MGMTVIDALMYESYAYNRRHLNAAQLARLYTDAERYEARYQAEHCSAAIPIHPRVRQHQLPALVRDTGRTITFISGRPVLS